MLIASLRAGSGMGIELLDYLTPASGRLIPADSRPDDIASWQTPLELASASSPLKEDDAHWVNVAGRARGLDQGPRRSRTGVGDAMNETNQEQRRLEQSRKREKHWKRWGPYLSERAWGTVREDYSAYGTAWDSFSHDQARSRAYRWNEDGLGGICDNHQHLCFAIALWNGKDPILKERLFGLTGSEGNHGEDVKEYYFYLDSTPTHSYMKFLYKYPQRAFPYSQLVEENRKRDRRDPEFELLDTGVFEENRYFDVQVEYAKEDIDDIAIRITITNRGSDTSTIDVLPTLWFRNTWSWVSEQARPEISIAKQARGQTTLLATKAGFDSYQLYCEGTPDALFTENETNFARLFGAPNRFFAKDGINNAVVHGATEEINPEHRGSKASARYQATLEGGASTVFRLRLSRQSHANAFTDFDSIFDRRIAEADGYYQSIIPQTLSADERNVMRQSLGGLLWSKQFYHYVVKEWLDGDPNQPPPPPERLSGRNCKWGHLYNEDVLSMPDKWEYPWFAAWDLAFHCIALSIVDADFAKEQLVADVARVVHASQRPTPGLRMGFWGRKPAGTCVGRMACVSHRGAPQRRGRHPLSGVGVSQTALELYLVGQPERLRWLERFRRRVPWSGQHRCVRSQLAAPGRTD